MMRGGRCDLADLTRCIQQCKVLLEDMVYSVSQGSSGVIGRNFQVSFARIRPSEFEVRHDGSGTGQLRKKDH